jgi:hypothetical protein
MAAAPPLLANTQRADRHRPANPPGLARQRRAGPTHAAPFPDTRRRCDGDGPQTASRVGDAGCRGGDRRFSTPRCLEGRSHSVSFHVELCSLATPISIASHVRCGTSRPELNSGGPRLSCFRQRFHVVLRSLATPISITSHVRCGPSRPELNSGGPRPARAASVSGSTWCSGQQRSLQAPREAFPVRGQSKLIHDAALASEPLSSSFASKVQLR